MLYRTIRHSNTCNVVCITQYRCEGGGERVGLDNMYIVHIFTYVKQVLHSYFNFNKCKWGRLTIMADMALNLIFP